jgi:hypothetical protein
VLERLLALPMRTMRTLPMSRTTFSDVSFAWKSKSSGSCVVSFFGVVSRRVWGIGVGNGG